MKGVKTYRRMLGFLRPHLPLFAVSAALAISIVLLDGMSIWFLGTLPQALFDPEAISVTRPEFSLRNLHEMLKYWTYVMVRSERGSALEMVCVLIAVTFTLKNIGLYANQLITQLMNLRVARDIRNLLYHHVLMLPVAFYDRNRTGKLVSLLLNDVNQINVSMTRTLEKLIMEPMRVVFFVTLLFVINWRLTLIVFILYPLFTFLIVKIGRSVRRRSRRMLQTFSGAVGVLTETIHGVRAVKMFNMNHIESENFRHENRLFVKSSFRSDRMRAILSPLTETLGVYATIVLLWYGGRKALADTAGFNPVDFFRFLLILFSSYKPFKTLASVNNSIQGGIAAAQRVFELLDLPTEDLQPLNPDRIPSFTSKISFEHVDFRYPGCDELVLRDVSFSVKKGQVVAVVGSSGSGKSTLLDLLPRFYEVQQGRITIDGQDIREFDLVGLRHLFGIVSQETILFNDTVQNNIAYGLPGAGVDEITEAARAANALEFIERLPEGFGTMIGERGVSLSGGQRQRLAIARALLRNPPILILDEATSALDTESELLVQRAIDTLVQNRTTFMVAHRLSTVRHADMILVLEDGRLVERGTHDQLHDQSGRYRTLYDLQFGNLSL